MLRRQRSLDRRQIDWGSSLTGCRAPARLWLSAALLLLAAGASAAPLDPDLPFEVTAREIEYDSERQLLIASQNVRLVQLGNTLEANWVAYNQGTGRGVATGDVVFVEGDERLTAELVEFSIDPQRGLVLDGRYDTGPGGFVVTASQLIRTGSDTYDVGDGSFTTCRCPDDDDREPWQIRAEETDMTIGGYAYSKNAKLAVLDVPLIWLPRLIFPVKSERESGLLFPEFDVGSRNGVDIGLPIFIAAGESVNVTATPRYLSKRGFKGDLAVEAVYGTRSYSELFASYVRDGDADAEQSLVTNANRWAIKYRHDQDLPGDLRVHADLRFASDNDYVVDFKELRRHRIDRFLESSARVAHGFGADGRFSTIASIAYADDLQTAETFDRDKYLLQRLPELSATALTGPLGPLEAFVGSMGADYTYFHSGARAKNVLGADAVPFQLVPDPMNPGSFIPGPNPVVVGDSEFLDLGIDAIRGTVNLGDFGERDGEFQEGEPLGDRGHRVVLHPRLGLPLRLFDRFDAYPEIGYQQLLYDSDAQGFAERGMLTARFDLATRLRARLELPALPELEHIMEPKLSWAFVDPSSQRGNPLFRPGTAVPQQRLRQYSYDNVVLDDADRVERSNRLRLSLSNRYYLPAGAGQPRRLWAELSLSSEFDFATNDFGSVILETAAYPLRGPQGRLILGYDPENKRLDEALVDVYTRLPRGIGLSMRYRYLRRIPRFADALRSRDDFDQFETGFSRANQFDLALRIPLISRFTMIYAISYSFEQSLTIGNRGGIEYRSKCECWAVGVDVSQDRVRGIEFGFRYTLLGLGDDRLGGSVLGEDRLGGLF